MAVRVPDTRVFTVYDDMSACYDAHGERIGTLVDALVVSTCCTKAERSRSQRVPRAALCDSPTVTLCTQWKAKSPSRRTLHGAKAPRSGYRIAVCVFRKRPAVPTHRKSIMQSECQETTRIPLVAQGKSAVRGFSATTETTACVSPFRPLSVVWRLSLVLPRELERRLPTNWLAAGSMSRWQPGMLAPSIRSSLASLVSR